MGATNNKAKESSGAQPTMPNTAALRNSRKGGLGRGLGSLIPPAGPKRPSLGNGAADVILGMGTENGRRSRAGQNEAQESQNVRDAAPTYKRHSDKTEAGSETVKKRPQKSKTGTKAGASSAAAEARDATPPDHGTESGSHGTPHSATAHAGSGPETEAGEFGATYRELPIHSIRQNAKQPRTIFDAEALEELVHSVKEFGVMQPIVVRYAPDGDTDYELIMGERRLRASTKAGLSEIPAIIRETNDDEMLRDALLENIHRVQLNPLEEASAYQQLMEEFGVTQEQLAKKIGRSRPLITNMIRLLQLPISVQKRVGAGVLSAGHARALLGLKQGEEAQERLAQRIVAEGLSVRATEEVVTLLNRGDEKLPHKREAKRRGELPEAVNNWVSEVGDALDTKVSVQMGKKRGKIVVEFGGPEDFERIAELLRVDKPNN